MEKEPQELTCENPTDEEEIEALEQFLKEKEGEDIRVIDPKKERGERRAARKKTKRLLANFGQKELFKENA